MVDLAGRTEDSLLALRRRIEGVGSRWRRGLLAYSLPDWLLVLYLVPIGVAVGIRSPRGWSDPLALLPLASILVYMAWARTYRNRWRHNPWVRTFYHATGIPTLALTYFHLRSIIPTVNAFDADRVLAAADLRLLPQHAAVLLEPLANRFTVEWFSFFYQLYIYAGGIFLLAMVLLDRDQERQGRFAVGVLLLLLGHLIYLFVPARGPYEYLAHACSGPLPGGPIYAHVMATQIHAGPGLDAFPSLHTAITLYLVAFVRQYWPRYRWVGYFLASQISVATVFLRFHYVVDVVAGAAFGFLVIASAPRLLDWYRRLRIDAGVDARDPW